MIKNVIFDFGDVLINLDKRAIPSALKRLGFDPYLPEFSSLNQAFEIGALTPEEFLRQASTLLKIKDPKLIIRLWNSIIADFPLYRLEFLESLVQQDRLRLFLLSNTNVLHIDYVKKQMGLTDYERFVVCFEGFHLSHEMGMRKPDSDIFEYVLNLHGLNPGETLFIDDTEENTLAASSLGIRTWHLQVGREDVTSIDNYIQA